MGRMLILFTVWTFVFSASVHAMPGAGTDSFAFGGKLLDSSGAPVSGSVSFKFQIYDPSGTCLLYEEDQTITVAADGAFAHYVGTGTRASVGVDGGVSWKSIFKKSGVVRATSTPNCTLGYSAVSNDIRNLRVTANADVLTPDFKISSVPFATTADTLQGLVPADFVSATSTQLSIRDGVSGNYINFLAPTLAAHRFFTFPADYGSNGQFLTSDGSGGLNWSSAPAGVIGGLNADLTTVGPALGNGNVLTWDQAQNKWITAPPPANAVSSVAGKTGVVTLNAADISGLGTASLLNAGTAANNLVQLNGIGKIDISLLDSFAADLSLNGYRITNLGAPSVANDAATKGYVDSVSGSALSGLTGEVTATGPGTVTATINAGAVTSSKIANDAVMSSKINSVGVAANRLLITDASAGNSVTYATCALGEVLKWTASGWGCAVDNSSDNLGNHTATANLTMSSNRIVSLADPTAAQDAATKNYIDSNFLARPGGTMNGALTMSGFGGATTAQLLDMNTGYSGNFVDYQVNGLSKFRVNSNGVITGDGSNLVNVPGTIGGLTANRIPFASSGSAIADDADFSYNTVGDVLSVGGSIGVGGIAPTSRVHILDNGNSNLKLESTNPTSSSVANFKTSSRQYQVGAGGSAHSYPDSFFVYDMTAGIPRFTVASNGNVGIGDVATPITQLQVGNGVTATNQLLVMGNSESRVSSTGIVPAFTAMNIWGGIHNGSSIELGQINVSASPRAAGSIGAALVNNTPGQEAGYLVFSTAGSGNAPAERMRIDNVGRVGIGTTFPVSKLDFKDANNANVSSYTSARFSLETTHGSGTPPNLTTSSVDAVANSAYGTSKLTAQSGSATVLNTGTVTTANGVEGVVVQQGTGGINQAIGVAGFVQKNSTGGISDAIGGYFKVDNTASGAITNGYGIKVGPINAAGGPITNKYSIMTTDASAMNVFAGNVGINNPAPQADLDVFGHVAFGGPPVSSVSACGTSPSVTGSDVKGTVTIGTGTVTSCVVNFAQSFNSFPVCVVTWKGNTPNTATLTVDVTMATMTVYFSASSPGKSFNYFCMQ